MRIEEKIGARIKEIRNKADVSQLKLSEICNLDRTYINSVENGHRNISIVNIQKIANALNTNLKDFFNDEKFT